MKLAYLVCVPALAVLLAAGAFAQEADPGPPPGGSPEAAAAQQKAMQQFDADGDGQFSLEELGQARAFLQDLRRAISDRRGDREPRRAGDEPRPPRDRGPRAAAGPQDEAAPGEGPRRPRGLRDRRPPRPGAGPEEPLTEAPRWNDDGGDEPPRALRGGDPMRLFERFDADGNGELNRDEFRDVMGAIRERSPGGGPEGPRAGDRGDPAGPRELGRRGPREAGPPRSEGDEPNPPRRPLRPRDGERRRPPREVEPESDEATSATTIAPTYDGVF